MKTINFYFEKFKYGGIERVFLNLLKNIDENDYKVRIFILNDYDVEDIIKEIPSRIEIVILKNKKQLKENMILKLINLFKNYFIIKKKISVNDINVNFYDSLSTLIIVSLLKNKYSWVHTNPEKLINKKRYVYLYKKMDKIIFICEEQKEVFLMNKSLIKIPMSVIYNILDYDKIDIMSKNDIDINGGYLISIARIDFKQKDYLTLLKAYKKLLDEKITNLNLIILGDGPDRMRLESEIKKMKLEKKISVLGNKSNPYIYLKKASALILSTYGEGLPTVILEAQYCGIPVIASNVKTGIKELLLNPICGSIFEVGDSDDLFLKIKYILENPKLKDKYIKIGKKNVQKFYPEKIIKKIKIELV